MTNHERNRRNNSTEAFSQYVKNKLMYATTTFRIREDGSTCWLLNGSEVEDKEFKEAYPIGLINRVKGERLDSRQNIY